MKKIIAFLLLSNICLGKAQIPVLDGNSRIEDFDIFNSIAIPYTDGDYLTALNNVKQMYNSLGFLKADIGWSEDYSTLHIREGTRCTLDQIKVIDVGFELSPKTKNKLIYSAMKFKNDDFCSDENAEKYLTNLKLWLKKNHYYFAQVSDFRKYLEEDQTRMDMEVNIYLGHKVEVDYSGTKLFGKWYKWAARKLSPINDLSALEEGASSSTNLDQFMQAFRDGFKKLYTKKGFQDVDIKLEIYRPSNEDIVLKVFVEENKRWMLGDFDKFFKIPGGILFGVKPHITWKNVHAFSEEELTKVIVSNLKSYRGSSNIFIVFDETILQEALVEIFNMYQSNGYLFAKLDYEIKSILEIEDQKLVEVEITADEGAQTRIQEVQIKGADQIKTDTLLKILGMTPNMGFDILNFEKKIQKLQDYLYEEGYYDAEVFVPNNKLIYSNNNQSVKIPIQIILGSKYTADLIYPVGNFFTKDSAIIEREMIIQQGDLLTPSLVRRAQGTLANRTPLASVDIELKKDRRQNTADVEVKVAESNPGQYSIGPFYRTDLGGGIQGNLSYNNLFRRMINYSLQLKSFIDFQDYHYPEYILTNQVRYPNFFRTVRIDGNGFANLRKRDLENFDYKTAGFGLGFSKGLNYFNFSIDYNLSNTEIFNATNPEVEETFTLGSITPKVGFTLNRDALKLTISHSHEVAREEFPSSSHINYFRPVSRLSLLWNINKNFSFRSRNQVGIIYPMNKEVDRFPINKRFRLGGFETLRGFKQDSIAFDKTSTIEEMSMLASGNDLIYWINELIGLSAILDFGNVYQSKDFSKEHSTVPEKGFLRENMGAALNASTPIGIFNFGAATPLDPLPYEDGYKIFFSFFN